MDLFTRAFWTDTGERAVKTFAQAVLAFFGSDVVLNVVDADWGEALAVGAGAAVLSIVTSVAGIRVGTPGTASVAPGVPLPDQNPGDV